MLNDDNDDDCSDDADDGDDEYDDDDDDDDDGEANSFYSDREASSYYSDETGSYYSDGEADGYYSEWVRRGPLQQNLKVETKDRKNKQFSSENRWSFLFSSRIVIQSKTLAVGSYQVQSWSLRSEMQHWYS